MDVTRKDVGRGVDVACWAAMAACIALMAGMYWETGRFLSVLFLLGSCVCVFMVAREVMHERRLARAEYDNDLMESLSRGFTGSHEAYKLMQDEAKLEEEIEAERVRREGADEDAKTDR